MSTFKTIFEVLTLVSNSKFKMPIMLRGKHGIGKTALFQQLAEETNREYFAVYGAQLTEGDILGIPRTETINVFDSKVEQNLDKEVTDFALPKWLVKACSQPSVVVFEEIDRADPNVRKAFMQLACERKLWSMNLHHDTIIGAAINGGVHGMHYDVGDMDPAEKDRWAIYDFNPSVEEWIEWAQTKELPDVLIDYLKVNRNVLEHDGDFEMNSIYPSRRSWTRYAEILRDNNLLEDPKDKEAQKKVYELGKGMVGEEISILFQTYLKELKIYGPEDILKMGKALHQEILKDEMADQGKLISIVKDMVSPKFDHLFEEPFTDLEMKNLVEFVVSGSGELFIEASRLLATRWRDDIASFMRFSKTEIQNDVRSVQELLKLSKKQLKKECFSMSLDESGNKPDLAKRIHDREKKFEKTTFHKINTLKQREISN